MIMYTGIGSRETPESVLRIMRWLGYQLATQGWVLRSGGADGADYAFERGVLYHTHQHGGFNADKMRIYLPGPRFKTRSRLVVADPTQGYCDASSFPNWSQAVQLASTVHPAWDRVERNPWFVALHARNCYQVLGDNLASPSEMVVFWAPLTRNGDIRGGTRTAVVLAQRHGIPTYNLAIPEDYEQLLQLGV